MNKGGEICAEMMGSLEENKKIVKRRKTRWSLGFHDLLLKN